MMDGWIRMHDSTCAAPYGSGSGGAGGVLILPPAGEDRLLQLVSRSNEASWSQTLSGSTHRSISVSWALLAGLRPESRDLGPGTWVLTCAADPGPRWGTSPAPRSSEGGSEDRKLHRSPEDSRSHLRTLTEEKGLWEGTAGYEPHCLPGGRA